MLGSCLAFGCLRISGLDMVGEAYFGTEWYFCPYQPRTWWLGALEKTGQTWAFLCGLPDQLFSQR